MSFRILSAILRQTWAIDERYALAHGWLVSNILNGLEFKPGAASLKPSKVQTSTTPNGKEYICIIPIHGVMMKYDQEQLCDDTVAGTLTIGRWIREAASDPEVKAIILDIDTPGGTVDGTQLLADTIAKVAKPIISFSNGLIASAGVWIASASDEIWVSDGTVEIGSIGVQISFADMRPMWEKQGINFHLIRSDHSPDKNEDIVQAIDGKYDLIKKESLNPLATMFIGAVKSNRGDKLKSPDQVTTGKVFFAFDALNFGLIDRIGSIEAAISRALELAEAQNKQSTNKNPKNATMKKYATIEKVAGIEIEATDDGLFLNHEIAAAIDLALANAETKKTELENSASLLQTKLDDQALAAQQATSDLGKANEKIIQLNNRIAELEKYPAGTGGGAGTNGDTFESKEEESSDDEAKQLYQTRQRAIGNK